MFKTLIFGGTTEGRELAEFCVARGISADVSVTTELGAELLPSGVGALIGRLSASEMAELVKNYSLVLDATHPYAEQASANISAACEKAGTELFRVLRGVSANDYGETVSGMAELIEKLNSEGGVILSTLGCKEAAALTEVSGYPERVWLRILPDEKNIAGCAALGFPREHIIAARGPFSAEENISDIERSGAEILITKNSGAAGGYFEKAEAARRLGIKFFTVERPRENGISLEKANELLAERSGM